jgi:hypothetical protein
LLQSDDILEFRRRCATENEWNHWIARLGDETRADLPVLLHTGKTKPHGPRYQSLPVIAFAFTFAFAVLLLLLRSNYHQRCHTRFSVSLPASAECKSQLRNKLSATRLPVPQQSETGIATTAPLPPTPLAAESGVATQLAGFRLGG